MKFAVVVLAFVAAASAQFNQGQYNAGKYSPFAKLNRYPTPAPYRPFASSTFAPPVYSTRAPVVPVVPKVYNSDSQNANIVKYGNEINPDGSYNYFYEADNGIAAQEQGVPRNLGGNPPVAPVVSQGSYSYTSPEGVPVAITYVADEQGFQPQGNVIPTAPPVPPQILRALEYIARNTQN